MAAIAAVTEKKLANYKTGQTSNYTIYRISTCPFYVMLFV